ncbi:translation initiation factor [Pirellula sp. SH-Sr6A]|uniref:translation initiation factor n=1 Tax=Pirellula sp. SH-Sr6A TaxID=1632865 RepID=UPI0014393533|nr:translation initiation factor [Pirellula sp. SH-Sr6A]
MGLFDGTSLERPVLCERCHQDIKVCTCPPPDVPPGKQRVSVRLEKRKNQRFVTQVAGFACPLGQIQQLLLELKNQCGAGGSCGEDWLEIQGDHKTKIESALIDRGYRIAKGKGK